MATTHSPEMDAGRASDRAIVISRTLAAPRELVWRTFVEAKHVGQWWGPDGTDYPNRVIYRELLRPRLHPDLPLALQGVRRRIYPTRRHT